MINKKKVELHRKGDMNKIIHDITYKINEKDNCNNIKTAKNSKHASVLIQ